MLFWCTPLAGEHIVAAAVVIVAAAAVAAATSAAAAAAAAAEVLGMGGAFPHLLRLSDNIMTF